VSARCLPLGVALVMHLYPLCALRCVPLPWFGAARLRRASLLRAIDGGGLILANAGSERATGAHAPVTVTRSSAGLRVNGTYEYMSLASVADLVLFCAPLAGSGASVFCAAGLHGDSVRAGTARFAGSMRLSDTCPVTFEQHPVPPRQFLDIPGEAARYCMSRYQRSWFQLLLAASHLARIERLRQHWQMEPSPQERATLNEIACLQDYALQLLDRADAPGAVSSLARVSAAIKLRVSWEAQAMAQTLQRVGDESSATELGFLRLQPTSDERILQAICAAPGCAVDRGLGRRQRPGGGSDGNGPAQGAVRR
jgi:alkylation response protein AidB-like acyl-CoA dehydrogenase